jgi:hypothetical protein
MSSATISGIATYTHESMPTALITGIGGQDGSYLSGFFLNKGV